MRARLFASGAAALDYGLDLRARTGETFFVTPRRVAGVIYYRTATNAQAYGVEADFEAALRAVHGDLDAAAAIAERRRT